MIGRVLQGSGGTYRVRAGSRELECSLRGRIKQGNSGSVAVGDRVHIEELDDGSCRITEILPRQGVLARRAMARRRDQIMAANLDQLAIVVATKRPELDLHMLDRLLAVAELNDLDPIIVCNKTDLTESRPSDLDLYQTLGYDVLLTSVKLHIGIDELHERLAGRTTVLAGASGVGKSSLLNAMIPGLNLRVGDVGERKGRGRHTTTSAQLIPIDDSDAFPEFRSLGGTCRFADCKHKSEPGCSVLEALANNQIDQRRYEAYLAILAEAELAELDSRTRGDG